jgi:teichuronic acid exporter
VAGLLSLAFVLAAPEIAAYFGSPGLCPVVRAMSIILIISSLTTVQEAMLRKNMKFGSLTQAKIAGTLGGGIIGIGMAWMGFGVWSLVAQTIVSRLISGIGYWLSCEWRPKLVFRIVAIKELWSFSFNLFLSGILNSAFSQIDSLIIARVFSPTELGFYSRAKSLNSFVVRYSSDSIGAVTFPAMSAIKQDRRQLLDLGLRAEVMVAFLAFGLLGWLYVSSEPLIISLFGAKWQPTVDIFKLLCLSGFAYPVSAATLSMLKASGDSRSFLTVEMLKKAVALSCLVVGFQFGLRGFLISLVVSGTISVLLNMGFVGKSLGISVGHQIRPLLVYMPLAIGASVVTMIIPFRFGSSLWQLLNTTTVFFVSYGLGNAVVRTTGLSLFLAQLKKLGMAVRSKVSYY